MNQAPRLRRDAGRPRGEAIEIAIFEAAIAELAAHGVSGFRVARVAGAAEVNKTSIYRRWPSPDGLIAAAVKHSLQVDWGTPPDTGALEADLAEMLYRLATHLETPKGRAIVMAALGDDSASIVAAVSADPASRPEAIVGPLVSSAAARGEWDVVRNPPGAILAMLAGAALNRVLMERAPVTDDWARALARTVAAGVR